MEVFDYPAPPIKWHEGAKGLVNANPDGIVAPKAAPAVAAPIKGGKLTVNVETATDLSSPTGDGAHRYCISAFYYNEAMDVVERRRTEPQAATSCSSRPGVEDCGFKKQVKIPYNSRQQFVQVAVYVVDTEGCSFVGDGNVNPFVGEAHVPIADPRSETLTSWPLMRGGAVGEQTGNLVVELRLPGPEDDSDEPQIAATPVAVPAAAVAIDVASARNLEPAQIPPPPPPPPSRPPPPDVGDAVEVFSRSAGQWQLGRVIKADGSDITVEYCGRLRLVNVNDRDLGEYFRLVEDQETAIARLGNPARVTDAAGKSEPRRQYGVGEAVEVFSASAGKWLQGKVDAVSEAEISVSYGDRKRNINLALEDYTTILRPPELPEPPPATNAASGCPYVVGDCVEIFSQSAGAWMKGTVVVVEGYVLTVEYSDRQRVIDLRVSNVSEYFRPGQHAPTPAAGLAVESLTFGAGPLIPPCLDAPQLPAFPSGLGAGAAPLPTVTARFGDAMPTPADSGPLIDWGIKPLGLGSAIGSGSAFGQAGMQRPLGLSAPQLQGVAGVAAPQRLSGVQSPHGLGYQPTQGYAPQRAAAPQQPQAPGGFRFR